MQSPGLGYFEELLRWLSIKSVPARVTLVRNEPRGGGLTRGEQS